MADAPLAGNGINLLADAVHGPQRLCFKLCGDLLGIKLPANQRIGDLPERALCRALISGDEFVGKVQDPAWLALLGSPARRARAELRRRVAG